MLSIILHLMRLFYHRMTKLLQFLMRPLGLCWRNLTFQVRTVCPIMAAIASSTETDYTQKLLNDLRPVSLGISLELLCFRVCEAQDTGLCCSMVYFMCNSSPNPQVASFSLENENSRLIGLISLITSLWSCHYGVSPSSWHIKYFGCNHVYICWIMTN